MRIPLLPALIFILLNLLVDAYIYRALKRRCDSLTPSRIQLWTSAALQIVALIAVCLPRRSGDNAMLLTVMWMLFSYLSVYFAKYLFVLFDLLARIPELFRAPRARWLSRTGAVLGGVFFLSIWWGALFGRYIIDVKEVEIPVSDLPESFEGLRIAQISDLHTGTFGTDTTFVSRLVDSINAQRPDVIVFTGDIVNQRSAELEPHLRPLSRLKAPMGVYSILGNHDYGDYSNWPGPYAKEANLEQLKEMQTRMGWRLLLNETEVLRRGSDSIAIIGVENIGDPPFHIYGSLAKACPAVNDSVTKILLSHNPAHWADSISGRPDTRIALTLSGHTHAMQAEIGGISPAALRYREWGGLYYDRDSLHALYVNIGAGTVGFPARVGAAPEITILTLKQKTSR